MGRFIRGNRNEIAGIFLPATTVPGNDRADLERTARDWLTYRLLEIGMRGFEGLLAKKTVYGWIRWPDLAQVDLASSRRLLGSADRVLVLRMVQVRLLWWIYGGSAAVWSGDNCFLRVFILLPLLLMTDSIIGVQIVVGLGETRRACLPQTA